MGKAQRCIRERLGGVETIITRLRRGESSSADLPALRTADREAGATGSSGV